MLHHLLYLFALMSLGAATTTELFSENKKVDISDCPVTFYQKVYNQLYVNFTSENFVICFDGFYDPSAPNDCLLSSPSDDGSAYLEIIDPSSLENVVKRDVSTISNPEDCLLHFMMRHNGNLVIPTLISFGNQTAVGLILLVVSKDRQYHNPTETIDVYVDGKYSTVIVTTADKTEFFIDASGCRFSGQGFSPNTTHAVNETCSVVSCSLDRSITVSSCNDGERCDGYGRCLTSSICTVTGPAVVDVHNDADFVGDRCSYTLVSDSGFQILAHFRDRRRTDVSFVDSVTLRLDDLGIDILLKQDGRVLVDGSPLTLNSSVQEVHGVQLSKDQTGVTAKVTTSGRSASVFFDGDTAQILMEGPAGSSLDGLCGNSSSFSRSKLSEDVSSSCETPYTEAADSTIDCPTMTERCNLLQEEPFSSCNSVVDPAPYIAACSQTLCRYPAVDGLGCQFLWAYARACSLENATLESWWSEAECSPPEAFCQNQVCSDHEFCGEVKGQPGCLCRAVFASSYRESNSLGDATVCTQNSASVRLLGCLLRERNIDYSLLHLNDESCKGEMGEESGMVTFSFDSSNSCGAVITANDSHVIYKNTIMVQNSSSDIITRHEQVNIDFSCIHVQPEIKTVAFRTKDSSVVQHITSGVWNYTVTMKAYTDAARTQVVDSNTDVMLDQKIWVELETEGLDAGLIAVVTDSCWATAHESSSSTPRYDLIQNGCANTADQTVKVEVHKEGTSNYFSFGMFKFTGSSGGINLHCKLELCVKEGKSCVPDCSGGARRRRRAVRYKRGASAFVSMAWIN